jgi:maleate cis-trans isomerase
MPVGHRRTQCARYQDSTVELAVIAALAEDLSRPVLTGNRVAFWRASRLAGVEAEVDNSGHVFKTEPNRK